MRQPCAQLASVAGRSMVGPLRLIISRLQPAIGSARDRSNVGTDRAKIVADRGTDQPPRIGGAACDFGIIKRWGKRGRISVRQQPGAR